MKASPPARDSRARCTGLAVRPPPDAEMNLKTVNPKTQTRWHLDGVEAAPARLPAKEFLIDNLLVDHRDEKVDRPRTMTMGV